MNTHDKKISVLQLYSIFFVCRIMSLFTFTAPRDTAFSRGDRLLLFVPFVFFEFMFALPVFAVTKKQGTLTSLTENISPTLAKITAVLYFAGFSWSAAVSTARFGLFTDTVMFSDGLPEAFMLLLTAAGVYIGSKGIQTTGRCCSAVLALTLFSIAVIVVFSVKDADVLNLTPPLENGVLPVIKTGVASAARTTELPALLFIQPRVNGNAKKGFFIWTAVFGAIACSSLGFISAVTGAYGDTQTFQLYTLTAAADFGQYFKADGILTAVWVLCSLFRTAFYAFIASETLNTTFDIKNKYLTYFLSGICVFIGSSLIAGKSGLLFSALLSAVNGILYAAFTAVLPVSVLLLNKIINKRRQI